MLGRCLVTVCVHGASGVYKLLMYPSIAALAICGSHGSVTIHTQEGYVHYIKKIEGLNILFVIKPKRFHDPCCERKYLDGFQSDELMVLNSEGISSLSLMETAEPA